MSSCTATTELAWCNGKAWVRILNGGVGGFVLVLRAALLALMTAGGLLVSTLDSRVVHAGEVQTTAATPARAETTVLIDNFTFSPKELTVAPGTTITWVNRDDIPHAIAANNLEFRSQALDTDDKFSFTFSIPGDYLYFCSLHPHMTGKIIVKAGGRPSQPGKGE